MTTASITIAAMTGGECNAKKSSEASAKYKVRTVDKDGKSADVYCVIDGTLDSAATKTGRACFSHPNGCRVAQKDKGTNSDNC